MRRIFFLILLCLASMPLSTITAQNSCDIDLEDAILQMVQAQRAVDAGDTLLATSILKSVQSTIDTFTDGCDSVKLTQKYTAPDESLTFSYPDGWTVQQIEGGPIIIASSPALITILNDDLPETLAPGEAAIALLMQPTDGTFDDSLDDLTEEVLDEFQVQGKIDDSVINGRRVVSMSIAFNENVRGRISLVDYSDADDPVAMLVFGLADKASLPIIEAYTDALQQSIQYPPGVSLRNIGVARESLSYSEVINLAEENKIMPSIPVSLSRDGTTLAWQGGDGLCVQELNQAEDCTELPDDFSGRTRLFQWSPDGRYITFQEDFFRTFTDADVWIFDVEEGSYIDLTDDGEAGFGFSDLEHDVWIDNILTWGPDNQIYLLRTAIEAGGKLDTSSYELLRIDPDTGDISQIQDLTGLFEALPVFYQTQYSLDGVMSVSPDASQMVMSVIEAKGDSPNNGIWLIDLSGGNDPQQIATTDQFITGYDAEIFEDGTYQVIESLAWDADGTGLYVYAYVPMGKFQFNMVYHMDLESDEIIPMVDLTSYTYEDFSSDDEDALLPALELVPTSPILSPDYRGVIVGNSDRTAISAIPFDGQFGDPVQLYEADFIELFGWTSMMGSDGTALIAGNLFISD